VITAAFVLGAMAVVWVGIGFIGSNNYLALTMTMAIAAVYVFGALELRQYRHATSTLAAALAAISDQFVDLAQGLDEWLGSVHASLQNPVRLRIEGERIGLPGPALTPYLVGLLVMLGMLGTFLGMVVTLNGAVFALQGTADLEAMRAALAAPIKGLGLAFGTSVAGVAASAMLGLMSAFSRRERIQTAQLLDSKIATSLRSFSLTHQRQETFKALQLQSQALPQVVDKMQAMMAQMESTSRQLNERLLANQDGFHREVKVIYTDLAGSVDKSLKDSLTQSAQLAGESIKPVVEAAMTGIARDAALMHENMIDTTQLNLTAFAETFQQRSESLMGSVDEAFSRSQATQAGADKQRLEAWQRLLQSTAAALHGEWQQAGAQTLARQQDICATLAKTAQEITEHAHASADNTLGEITRLMSSSEDLMRSRIASEADWIKQHGARMDQLAGLLRSELGALRDEEAQRGNAAVERLGELQAALTTHLTTLGTALEAPITQLIHTASEAPRAAAEVIGHLRKEISSSIARDNELLEERSRIMETLNTLLDAINHASGEQRAVIDSLVATSAVALNNAGSQFAEQVNSETAKLEDIAAHVTSSAVEVSSLSEAFAFVVQSFNEANEKLIANLQRIEAALDKSMVRSDEQLAYYVAQAREIIDLSMSSQKEVFEELRQITSQTLPAEEVN
jgi:hypothetical protein